MPIQDFYSALCASPYKGRFWTLIFLHPEQTKDSSYPNTCIVLHTPHNKPLIGASLIKYEVISTQDNGATLLFEPGLHINQTEQFFRGEISCDEIGAGVLMFTNQEGIKERFTPEPMIS